MKKTGFVLRIILTLMVVLFVGQAVRPALASDPRTPRLPQEDQQQTLDLSQWGYDDVLLYGPYGTASYSLGLPANWEVLPGSMLNLNLDLEVSKSMVADPAAGNLLGDYLPAVAVQIVLNGVTIYTITEIALGPSTIPVRLPEVWPQPEGDVNRLDVILRIHGNCEYYQLSSLKISKSSSLALAYREKPLPLDLGSYPQPFYQRTFQPNSATIVIPANPTETERETALSIAASLGSLSNNRVTLKTITDAELPVPDGSQVSRGSEHQASVPGGRLFAMQNQLAENMILVGTPETNTVIEKLVKAGSLPVSLVDRWYHLGTSGPAVVTPGKPATFSLEVKNTGNASVDGLVLSSRLPDLAASVQCTPTCGTPAGQAVWPVNRLAPGEAAVFSVTYTLPENDPQKVVSLVSELLKDGQPVNVSELSSSVGAEGTGDTIQSAASSSAFFRLNGKAVSESDGVLQMAASPWSPDKALLLVTGLSDSAVQKAGRALTVPAIFPGMSGSFALIQDVLPAEAAGEVAAAITFADLGYSDELFAGIGRTDLFYQFTIPFDWTLNQEASVRLRFAHSSLLDPQLSSITLFLNDTPIASTALDETNALAGELTALLPARNALPGLTNTLLVQIETQLPDPCVEPDTVQAWVSIGADSSLNLAHSEVDVRAMIDLNYWPQAFITESDLSSLLLALPAEPTTAEWTMASQVAAFLGSASATKNTQMQVLLGEPGDMDLSGYQVIAIGRPTRSPLLQAVNDQLPQPFIPTTDSILQKVDSVVLRLPDGLDLGYLQVIPSPWNEERSMLVITGTTDAAVQQAQAFLLDNEVLWQLEGNLALIRGEEVFVTDTRTQTAAAASEFTATIVPEATLAVPVATTPEPAVTATVVAGAGPVERTVPTPYAKQYPYLLPGILSAGALLVIGLLAVGYIKERRRK